jgi:ATP-dependent exoDNAse (exonuclease V) alpha subunit
VEEGYVFASLVNLKIMQENHNPHDLFSQYSEQIIASELIASKRNQGQISELAMAILTADKKKLVSCLLENNSTILKSANLGLILAANCSPESSLSKYLDYAASQDLTTLNVKQLFSNLNQFANLCLTNRGVFGAENINSEIERKIKRDHAIYDEWYNGRPIMILQNDYNLELFNGDIGICIRDGEQVRIVFENNQQFIPELLPVFSLAYAITIHKSQGSEYSEVNVIIPESSTSNDGVIMVSRELFYTAVTRAKDQVTIFANQETLIRAIDNSATRVSGLNKMFATN